MKSHPIIIPTTTKLRLPNKIMCREERGVNIFVQFYFFSLNFAWAAWEVEGGSIQRGRFSFDFIEFANKGKGKKRREIMDMAQITYGKCKVFFQKRLCDTWQHTARTINCKKISKVCTSLATSISPPPPFCQKRYIVGLLTFSPPSPSLFLKASYSYPSSVDIF